MKWTSLLLLTCLLPLGCAAESEPAAPTAADVSAASAAPAASAGNVADTSPLSSSAPPASSVPSQAEAEEGRPQQARPAREITFTKVKFKSADGQVQMSLKPQSDGAKLVDGQEQELARYTLSGDKLKIKNAADETLGYIIAYPDRLKVRDATQKKELWNLRRQSDGDWKLEAADGTLACRVSKRDYGFEIEKPDDTSWRKIKLKDGKLSLRDEREQTYLSTKDGFPVTAGACLALEPIESQPIRCGLATMMLIRFP